MTDVTETIDVDVDVRTAYNQWTQFEEFPHFMEGVDAVEQIDDRHLRWEVSVGGVEREFLAEITDQAPDEMVAWRSTAGVDQGGVVTFDPIGAAKTRVTLQMMFEPEGVAEQVGDKLGVVKMRVKGDLRRFKEFIEDRGEETGGWRGEIPEGTSRYSGGESTTSHDPGSLTGDAGYPPDPTVVPDADAVPADPTTPYRDPNGFSRDPGT